MLIIGQGFSEEEIAAYRVKELKLRVGALRRRRESIQLTVLSCICLMFTSWISALFVTLPSSAVITTGFGTMLLYEDASGYVLVGLVAFVVGAVVTGVCVWWRSRH